MNSFAFRAQPFHIALLLGCLLLPAVGQADDVEPVGAVAQNAAPASPAPAGSAAQPADATALPAEATQPAAAALPGEPSAEAAAPQPAVNESVEVEHGLSHDLSPWGMYQAADWVVKAVMIGLVLASVITWTIALAKGLELGRAKRRLRAELAALKTARNLKQAADQPRARDSLSTRLI